MNVNAVLALDYIESTNTTVFLTGKAEPDLELDRERYASFLLSELFNFNGLKNRIKDFENLIDSALIAVAEKTARQLKLHKADRIKKAATYFYNALKKVAESLHSQWPALIGTSKEAADKANH